MIADTNIMRFIKAQEGVYIKVMHELKSGKKRSHWMWFIFPQVAGLGYSETSKYYSIKSINEAEQYLQHPVLGKRLEECCSAVLSVQDKSARDIFGSPDDSKLLSSMTLFSFVSSTPAIFDKVISKYYNDKKDGRTIAILKSMPK